jgi:hypothetical protein
VNVELKSQRTTETERRASAEYGPLRFELRPDKETLPFFDVADIRSLFEAT